MKRMLFVSALSLFVAVGCQSSPAGRQPMSSQTSDLPPSASDQERTVWREAQEDDIYEAVLRHGFGLYGPHMLGPGWRRELRKCTFFLAIEGEDPSDEFLARFAGEKPAVMRASEATFPERRERLGRRAYLNLGSIPWDSDITVTVVFHADAAPRAQAWWECTLLREGGRWVVRRVPGPRVT